MRFPLGCVVATPGALEVLGGLWGPWRVNAELYLERHRAGDWGEIPPEDARENERSLKHEFRLLSSYPVGGAGEKVWIITEADRSSTCLLLPSDTESG